MYALKEKFREAYLVRITIEPATDDRFKIFVTLSFSKTDFMLFNDLDAARAFARSFAQPERDLCVVEV